MYLYNATQSISPFSGNAFWKRSVALSPPVKHIRSSHRATLKRGEVFGSLQGQLDAPASETDSKRPTVKRKVAMWVGYVGTQYKGLQIQRTSAMGQTIEEELERAIYKAGGILESNFGSLEKIRWMRSSRTDKGVHSLSTVISFKLEIEQVTCGSDAHGIEVADSVNQHLPNSIRIFGIVPVNKSFDPRRGCCNRTYHYLLPARVIGISNESSTEEVQHSILKFQKLLTSFEGRHPYHNYTVRAHYRKRQGMFKGNDSKKGHAANKDINSSTLEDDEEDSDANGPIFDTTMSNPESNVVFEYLPHESSSIPEETQEAGLPSLKIRWLHERNMADKISAAHYRKILYFTCGELETFDGLCFLRLCVRGESFMLHQIRKMVGTAVAIMRDVLPSDSIPISLTVPCRMALPLAPSDGLLLASNEFFPFRTNSFNSKGFRDLDDLAWLKMPERVVKRKEEFWSNVLLPEMISLLKGSNSMWTEWLQNLELGRIPEAEMNVVRLAWIDWVEQICLKQRNAEKMEVRVEERSC